MLTLNAAALSPYAGNSVPYSAIATDTPAPGADTFKLSAPAGGSVQPVILQVTGGGAELQTFNAPLGTQRVDRVTYGSETFTAAANPSNLQPGEYVFNSLSLELTIYPTSPLIAGRSLLVQSVDPAAVLTEYLLAADYALPDIFYRYPVVGVLTWSCGWEEHPSGEFELITDWATADALEDELIPQVTELEIYGVGFQVADLTIIKTSPLENPNLEARVNVQLRGKWESYLEEKVVLDAPNGTAGGARTIRGNTTVQAIAAKVGAVATLPPNRIKAPIKPGEAEDVTLQDVFEGNLRHNGCFARYSSAGAIEAVKLEAVATHQVAYTDLFNQKLEIRSSANPRAFDFKNGRLEWGERATRKIEGEDTQGNREELLTPQWRLKRPDRRIEPVGSPRPDIPPADLVNAIDTSLIFDGGGPIKERTITHTENGAITKQTYEKWGVVAIACYDLYYRVSTGWYKIQPLNPAAFWQKVEEWEANYFYDHSTGYLTGGECHGSRLLRLKSESKNESCGAYDEWFKANDQTRPKKRKQLDFYEFSVRPLYEESAYKLDKFRNHYRDMPPRPTEEAEIFFPEFNADGTRSNVFVGSAYDVKVSREEKDGEPWIRIKYRVPVPGWVDPRFCAEEVNKRSCFMSAPDPDSSLLEPRPDLVAGEYRDLDRRLNVPDFRYQDRSGSYIAENFIEYTRLQTQKDVGFARAAKETVEEQQKGRPNEHTKKEKIYEKVDPTEDEPDPDEWEWVISTAAVEDDRIVGDTASYPYASTYQEAMTGLVTDLEINNTRDTKLTAVELHHALMTREGDLLNLEGHGAWRVLSYRKSLAILAPGVIQPGRMQLDLGKRISGTAIAVTKRLKPKPPPEDSDSLDGEPLDGGNLLAGYPGRGNRG